MKIEVRLSNRFLYTFLSLISLVLVAILVQAYGTSNPSSFGHSIGEVAPPSPCSSNQLLLWNGNSWICTNNINNFNVTNLNASNLNVTNSISVTNLTVTNLNVTNTQTTPPAGVICPAGFSKISSSSQFCIDSDERSAKSYSDAVKNCAEAGATLCSQVQWIGACLSGSGLTNLGNDPPEWTSEIFYSENLFRAIAMKSSGTCDTYDVQRINTGTRPYRCCK